ncbi:ABC-2 type transport system ATP-binding protein [Georgenia soli]|uniref:ABC-2 type transport system ATP-binding protein n=1 Tax=Georgenia soli TaxID=638953 RepID=A0A2A9EMG2_9MICO|nr:ABC-2 type transport system ATP-binding protein [Georgenia soli]
MAQTYDADQVHISGPDLASKIGARLAADLHGEVVELACGTGQHTLAYAPRCSSVIATDLSAPMLKEAGRKLGSLPNVTVRPADATSTGLPEGSADAVVAVNLLHIVPDPAAMLAEARRLLRPGGVLVVADATGQGLSPRQMVVSMWQILRRWGLRSGGGNLNQRALERLVHQAGFVQLRGELLTGRRMNAAYVRAVRPA